MVVKGDDQHDVWCRIHVLRLWSCRVMTSMMSGVGSRYYVCGRVG